MNLRSFLDTLPHGGIAQFARDKVGITTVYLQQLAARQDEREPSPDLSVRIWRESGQKVALWELRPNDWFRLWPMLIGTAGAPPVPADSGAQAITSAQ